MSSTTSSQNELHKKQWQMPVSFKTQTKDKMVPQVYITDQWLEHSPNTLGAWIQYPPLPQEIQPYLPREQSIHLAKAYSPVGVYSLSLCEPVPFLHKEIQDALDQIEKAGQRESDSLAFGKET